MEHYFCVRNNASVDNSSFAIYVFRMKKKILVWRVDKLQSVTNSLWKTFRLVGSSYVKLPENNWIFNIENVFDSRATLSILAKL